MLNKSDNQTYPYSPEVRIRRLDEQIAHLKLLFGSTEKNRVDAHRNVMAWTEKLMEYEAMVSSFQFRIEEHTHERDALVKIALKVKRKAR